MSGRRREIEQKKKEGKKYQMILHTSSNKDSWFVFIWFCFSWFGVSWVTVKLIYSTQTLGKGLRKEVWIFNKVNSILNGEKKNPVLSPQLVEMNEIEFIFNIDYSIILYQRGLFIKHFFFGWLQSFIRSNCFVELNLDGNLSVVRCFLIGFRYISPHSTYLSNDIGR